MVLSHFDNRAMFTFVALHTVSTQRPSSTSTINFPTTYNLSLIWTASYSYPFLPITVACVFIVLPLRLSVVCVSDDLTIHTKSDAARIVCIISAQILEIVCIECKKAASSLLAASGD